MPPTLRTRTALLWASLALAAPAAPLAAVTLQRGATRVVLNGEFLATLAPRERGYFNFTDYSAAPLRQARLQLGVEVRRGERLALVAELRSRNLEPDLSALYLRLRPGAGLDVQVGRIPPVFGGASQRGYGGAQVLVGLPLAYQYLTTVRADALPPSADALLRWRGGGWWPGYAPGATPGLPLVQGDVRDVGVEVRLGGEGAWELSAALTRGSLARPRVRDDNSGATLAARLQRKLGAAWTLGLSAARGAYLARAARASGSGDDLQRAFGCDLEFARGPALARLELLRSEWDVPSVRARPLGAWALSGEARVRVSPFVELGARLERLGFDELRGRTLAGTWDARVLRLESGAALRLRRDTRLRLAFQQNWRDGGYVRSEGLVLAQLGVRF